MFLGFNRLKPDLLRLSLKWNSLELEMRDEVAGHAGELVHLVGLDDAEALPQQLDYFSSPLKGFLLVLIHRIRN